MLTVRGARRCVRDTGQLFPKPPMCFPAAPRASRLGQRLVHFPALPVRRWYPQGSGCPSQANRIALRAERGGTEARKRCPNWSVRNVLGRGGEAADGGPAPAGITIVTERALLRVGASAQALRCPSRGDQVRWEPVVPTCFMLALSGSECHTLLERGA